jgi:hypothetical protein
MSRREEVIAELRRRLLVKLPSAIIIEGTGGIWGAWDKKIPCIHLFELPSKRILTKPGIYTVELPVQIEYVVRLGRQDGCNTEGRARLLCLQQALELDERFTKDRNLRTQSIDLVISYFCGSDEITSPLPNILDAAVLYVFKYVDTFYGYEKSRH